MTTRRQLLQLGATATFGTFLVPRRLFSATTGPGGRGAVVGNPAAAKVGEQVLADGGNAIDAAIAAAFAACVASPHNCGIGGYGGHATVGLASGKVVSFDFNSTAPAAARADMFSVNAEGKVKDDANAIGWLAAGVPGTVAGLDLILRTYGTRPLRAALAPAIALCEAGTHVAALKNIEPKSAQAPAGKERARNDALGRLLKTLAERNSAETFYRGDIAETIAAAFQRNGGLVTTSDLAAYRAREAAPLTFEWNGATFHTAPLPATGLLILDAFAILRELNWAELSADQQRHAKIDALRLAWSDRGRTFGDPSHVADPSTQLLDRRHSKAMSAKVAAAMQAGKPVAIDVKRSLADGTIHLSAADQMGNMIAVTLTHGNTFGARVVVEELGLVLGHGMSRFEPRPGFPNSIAPGKRPQTNMCPTIVTRGGKPVFAIGAAGGVRIPNAVYDVLLQHVVLGRRLAAAQAASRHHTDGTLRLGLEKGATAEEEAFLKKIGYETVRGPTANVSAVAFEGKSGVATGSSRGP